MNRNPQPAQYYWDQKPIKNQLEIFNPKSSSFTTIDPSTSNLDITMINPDTLNPSQKIVIDAKTIKKLFPAVAGWKISLTDFDLTKSNYNRLTCYIYPLAQGYRNFYFNISLTSKSNTPNIITHAPSLIPNQWNKVTWELGNFSTNNLTSLSVIPYVGGLPPEANPEVIIYLNSCYLEAVEADYDLGWDLDKRIAYCHSGYLLSQNKIAITQTITNPEFKLINQSDQVVYQSQATYVSTNLGKYYLLDFTSYNIPGKYYLSIDNHHSKLFEISDTCYHLSVEKSLYFLKQLRCGQEVPGVHSSCHQHSKTYNQKGQSVINCGGWHDAGDLSQFEICTAEMAHALLDYADIVEQPWLKQKLLNEAKVGINWLLQTRFGDGERALAVTYGLWHPTVLDPQDELKHNVSENSPFENFIAAAATFKAAKLYQDLDPIFSAWCQRVAIEDFNFAIDGYNQGLYAKRWGLNIDAQVCGAAVIAAVEAYNLTHNQFYLDKAKQYAGVVLKCQETEYIGEDILVRGFFYEDPQHQYLLTYEHRGHEQTPVQAIAMLVENFKEEPEYDQWVNCLNLYSEYILSTIKYSAPYHLLPGHIYILDKINYTRFTIPGYYCSHEEGVKQIEDQIKAGIKISNQAYLRIFPVSVQRRGFHATLLSKTKAVSMIAKVLNNQELRQLAIDQIEWILGKNPFGSSTMYGEGDNYHPLYVAYSQQMIGALPVGIKTYQEADIPYWPVVNNAVFKEVWGHTTGKYLWVLADIMTKKKH